MRLTAALQGDLSTILRAEARRMEAVARRSVADATRQLQEDLRAAVRAGGLPQNLANAWRMAVYPKGDSLRAAGLVYSSAPAIHHAFAEGVIIRGRSGQWLAIPTEAVPRKRGARGRAGRMTPADVEALFGRDLRFVPASGRRPALLVMDGARQSFSRQRERFGRARVAKRGGQSVVMFLLLRQVRLRKRFDIPAATQKAQQRLYADLAAKLVD